MREFKTAGDVELNQEKLANDNLKQELNEDKPQNEDENKEQVQDNKSDIKEKPKKVLNYPIEIYQLSKLLIKDGFKKVDLHKLRTSFIACTFTDQGVASSVEYETIIKNSNLGLTWETINMLLNLIAVSKDKSKISYFKLK